MICTVFCIGDDQTFRILYGVINDPACRSFHYQMMKKENYNNGKVSVINTKLLFAHEKVDYNLATSPCRLEFPILFTR